MIVPFWLQGLSILALVYAFGFSKTHPPTPKCSKCNKVRGYTLSPFHLSEFRNLSSKGKTNFNDGDKQPSGIQFPNNKTCCDNLAWHSFPASEEGVRAFTCLNLC